MKRYLDSLKGGIILAKIWMNAIQKSRNLIPPPTQKFMKNSMRPTVFQMITHFLALIYTSP
jgi:hypothetical protein